jgi:hypothetical protein
VVANDTMFSFTRLPIKFDFFFLEHPGELCIAVFVGRAKMAVQLAQMT